MPTTSRFWSPRRIAAALGLALLLALVSWGLRELDARQRVWIFQPSDRSWPGANTAGMQEQWIAFRSRDGSAARLHDEADICGHKAPARALGISVACVCMQPLGCPVVPDV